MNWSIIKNELGFRAPLSGEISRWAENYVELYGAGSRSANSEHSSNCSFGIIVNNSAEMYSHPLLERVVSFLGYATLIRVMRVSASEEWVKVEAIDRKQSIGWIRKSTYIELSPVEFKVFLSTPKARYNFLATREKNVQYSSNSCHR